MPPKQPVPPSRSAPPSRGAVGRPGKGAPSSSDKKGTVRLRTLVNDEQLTREESYCAESNEMSKFVEQFGVEFNVARGKSIARLTRDNESLRALLARLTSASSRKDQELVGLGEALASAFAAPRRDPRQSHLPPPWAVEDAIDVSDIVSTSSAMHRSVGNGEAVTGDDCAQFTAAVAAMASRVTAFVRLAFDTTKAAKESSLIAEHRAQKLTRQLVAAERLIKATSLRPAKDVQRAITDLKAAEAKLQRRYGQLTSDVACELSRVIRSTDADAFDAAALRGGDDGKRGGIVSAVKLARADLNDISRDALIALRAADGLPAEISADASVIGRGRLPAETRQALEGMSGADIVALLDCWSMDSVVH